MTTDPEFCRALAMMQHAKPVPVVPLLSSKEKLTTKTDRYSSGQWSTSAGCLFYAPQLARLAKLEPVHASRPPSRLRSDFLVPRPWLRRRLDLDEQSVRVGGPDVLLGVNDAR